MGKKVLKSLTMLICVVFIVGCSNTSVYNEQRVDNIKNVKVIMPDGLPAVSMAKMIKEKTIIKDGYNIVYNIEKTPDTLATTVMKQDADIAIVPSNMAAIAYNKTKNYQIAGTTGLGSFYLVSNKDIQSFNDLKGNKVANTGKGLTPDITTKFILKESGINEKDIDFTYFSSANELVPIIATGKVDTAIVPEPTLSALISKNENINLIKNLNEEYKNITNSKFGYPQATIIVKSDFAKENKEFVKSFLNKVNESVKFANENPNKVGECANEVGVSMKKEIISKSIENANLKFIKAKDYMKDYLDYYKMLSEFDINTLGGKLPDEKIFFKE